jgi:hypothetical protein
MITGGLDWDLWNGGLDWSIPPQNMLIPNNFQNPPPSGMSFTKIIAFLILVVFICDKKIVVF